MNSPFIPRNRANLIIISGEVEDRYLERLKMEGVIIVKTIPHPNLDTSIAYHPDMVICPIDAQKIVVEPLVYDYYKKELANFNIEVIRGTTLIKNKYPFDIAFNTLINGGYGFHNLKYTDKTILSMTSGSVVDWIDVKQGYTKCSVMIVDEDSIITADRIIADKWSKLGKEVLLIENGFVNLPGHRYGFIGGATGNLGNKSIIISGSLKSHPDFARIYEFLETRNIDLVNLGYDKIYDVGTILAFFYSH